MDNLEIIISKIDNGEDITDVELEDFLYEGEQIYEYRNPNLSRRYQSVSTVIKHNSRYFMLNWDKGLTEYQENLFNEQPYEVKEHNSEKTSTLTEWLKL